MVSSDFAELVTLHHESSFERSTPQSNPSCQVRVSLQSHCSPSALSPWTVGSHLVTMRGGPETGGSEAKGCREQLLWYCLNPWSYPVLNLC